MANPGRIGYDTGRWKLVGGDTSETGIDALRATLGDGFRVASVMSGEALVAKDGTKVLPPETSQALADTGWEIREAPLVEPGSQNG